MLINQGLSYKIKQLYLYLTKGVVSIPLLTMNPANEIYDP